MNRPKFWPANVVPTMSDLLVPGFNSDDPSTWQSKREKIGRELFNTAPLGAEGKNTMPDGAKEKAGVNLQAEVEARDEYIVAVNLYLNCKERHGLTFMLSEPANLTVQKPGAEFSKVPHIGGEYFILKSCYMGKRGKIIFRLTPDSAAHYSHVEMSETEASNLLAGFREFMAAMNRDDIIAKMREKIRDATTAKLEESEREKMAGKYDQYSNIGFGSW